MELLDIHTLAFLIFFGFMAAFVDSVVGGGGLISVPALMWTGLPPVTVLGTNKVAAVMGALTSFVTFLRSGKVDGWLIRRLFPFSLVGSGVGVVAVRLVPSEILRPLVVVMLTFVLIYSIVKKEWGRDATYAGMSRRLLMLSVLTAFGFGFYDGFFGPGTGSFLLFAFLMIGFDFVGAAANARALNFASNIAAAILFSYLGEVNFSYAIPMGISMIVGAWCGARVALAKGVGYVRPLFIIMTAVLIGKQILELLK
ncbi:MAG: sulfite exporter TauE/SafE family protein [Mitsuokella sp.]